MLRRQGLLAAGVTHVRLWHLPGWDEILLKQMLKGFSLQPPEVCAGCVLPQQRRVANQGEKPVVVKAMSDGWQPRWPGDMGDPFEPYTVCNLNYLLNMFSKVGVLHDFRHVNALEVGLTTQFLELAQLTWMSLPLQRVMKNSTIQIYHYVSTVGGKLVCIVENDEF